MITKESAKSVKTASIIHEIKQPLAAMTMLAELAMDDMDDPASQKRDEKIKSTLKEIVTQGQLCSRIIEKMNNPDERISANLEPTDINVLINRAVNKASYNGFDEEITVRQNLENNMPDIQADQDAILQLVSNLIKNAADSMKNSTTKILTVSSYNKPGEGITINVTDTGCGIDNKTADKIFNSFYTTKGKDGMGLGLSICKKIVNDHNGTITVKSGKNVGTQFNVLLPLNT